MRWSGKVPVVLASGVAIVAVAGIFVWERGRYVGFLGVFQEDRRRIQLGTIGGMIGLSW